MSQHFGIFVQRKKQTEKQPLLMNGSETTLIFRQWLGKHVPVAMDMCETIEVLLETVFSTWSVLRCYKQLTRLELSQSVSQ
jgi:hypothetical protein